ncbi:MAG: hypothetical protein RIC03_12560 [Cyclobacteriaceae bacterium]
MTYVFIIVGIVLFVLAASNLIKDSDAKEKRRKDWLRGKIDKVDGFNPSKTFIDTPNTVVSIDKENKKIFVKIDSSKGKVINYKKLIGCELLEDGEKVYSRSAGSTAGRVIAGSLILGPVGAIVGAATGKSVEKKKIKSLKLRLLVNDEINPIITIPFLELDSAHKPEGILVKDSLKSITEWKSVFDVILSNND